MTNSWRSVHFVLNQSFTRPDLYGWSLRFEMMPPETAGVLQHGLAVRLDVLAVADGPARGQVVEAAGQERFAINEGHVRKVVAAEIQEIEGVEDHPIRPARFQGLLQFGEAGYAGLLLNNHFAVDQR